MEKSALQVKEMCCYSTSISRLCTTDATIPVLISLQLLLQLLQATLKCTMLVSGCNDGVMFIYLRLQLLYFHSTSLHHNTAVSATMQ